MRPYAGICARLAQICVRNAACLFPPRHQKLKPRTLLIKTARTTLLYPRLDHYWLRSAAPGEGKQLHMPLWLFWIGSGIWGLDTSRTPIQYLIVLPAPEPLGHPDPSPVLIVLPAPEPLGHPHPSPVLNCTTSTPTPRAPGPQPSTKLYYQHRNP